jgi:hypothetical protein
MERELFREIQFHLRDMGRRRTDRRFTYTDAAILEVYLWAVIHDRPTVWACDPRHWSRGVRRGPLPSQSQVSRRLRSPSVKALRDRLEWRTVRRGRHPTIVFVIDGKALPIAGHSRDPHAGYGRATRGKAKGYKLHALVDLNGVVWAWRLAPMNTDERTMARRLLREMPRAGYVLSDANYDSNALFALASDAGVQMVVPRRYGPDRSVGHRAQHPARLRSRDMLENGVFDFGAALHAQRRAIERYFSTLTCYGGGLTCLPPWVRTHPRVHAWVQAKLILRQLRTDLIAARAVAV